MKKILGFAAATLLTLGLVPLGASAGHQDPMEEVVVADTAAGVEQAEGRTCLYVSRSDSHAAVAVSANPQHRVDLERSYDKHGDRTESTTDDSMC